MISEKTRARLDQAAPGLKAVHLTDFAVVQNELEIAEPREFAVPHIWKWREVSPWLDRVYSGMSLDEIHRRTLALSNPGLGGRPFATSTLLASISMYYPNDIANVHRHMANASRFMLEGKNAYTTVGGEKCPLERGDLVITPNGEWHDHGNDGTAPIVWVNVLDIPLVETLNAIMTEWEYFETNENSNSQQAIARKSQSFIHPPGYSDDLFGAGGIVPRFGPERRGRGVHSPKYLYRWERLEKSYKNCGAKPAARTMGSSSNTRIRLMEDRSFPRCHLKRKCSGRARQHNFTDTPVTPFTVLSRAPDLRRSMENNLTGSLTTYLSSRDGSGIGTTTTTATRTLACTQLATHLFIISCTCTENRPKPTMAKSRKSGHGLIFREPLIASRLVPL
jgi:gentisate 1,2-dioxygenase